MTCKVFYSEIKGYKLFPADRIGGRGGGGAFYVSDTLQCYVNITIKERITAQSL